MGEIKKKGKLGGARKGAGRKKGPMTVQAITKDLALKDFNDRVAKSTGELFNAAKSLALGQTFIYRLDEEEHQKKDGTKYTIKTPVLVTDPDEIRDAIDKLEFGGDSEEYYYATTKAPDIKAIDVLMNRSYGRPKESIEHSGKIQGIVGLITSLNNGDESDTTTEENS